MKSLEKTVFFAGNNLVIQAGEPPRHYYTVATSDNGISWQLLEDPRSSEVWSCTTKTEAVAAVLYLRDLERMGEKSDLRAYKVEQGLFNGLCKYHPDMLNMDFGEYPATAQ